MKATLQALYITSNYVLYLRVQAQDRHHILSIVSILYYLN
jgi:hypothetical protein